MKNPGDFSVFKWEKNFKILKFNAFSTITDYNK